MKTKFTPLVKIKKNNMDKCERDLQRANADLRNAVRELSASVTVLNQLDLPKEGTVTSLVQSRTMIESARGFVLKNREWVEFATTQMHLAKKALKEAMIEFEKFKSLEMQELQERLKKQKQADAKALDEIAGQAYFRNKEVL